MRAQLLHAKCSSTIEESRDDVVSGSIHPEARCGGPTRTSARVCSASADPCGIFNATHATCVASSPKMLRFGVKTSSKVPVDEDGCEGRNETSHLPSLAEPHLCEVRSGLCEARDHRIPTPHASQPYASWRKPGWRNILRDSWC